MEYETINVVQRKDLLRQRRQVMEQAHYEVEIQLAELHSFKDQLTEEEELKRWEKSVETFEKQQAELEAKIAVLKQMSEKLG